MKVYCINNEYLSLSIEVGKWYNVLHGDEVSDKTSCLISNNGKLSRISKTKFLTIEQLRKDKFNILGI